MLQEFEVVLNVMVLVKRSSIGTLMLRVWGVALVTTVLVLKICVIVMDPSSSMSHAPAMILQKLDHALLRPSRYVESLVSKPVDHYDSESSLHAARSDTPNLRSSSAQTPMTLEEAYFTRMRAVRVADLNINLTILSGDQTPWKTQFLPNMNFLRYPLLALENVCMEPAHGTILLVNVSTEEVKQKCEDVPELYHAWNDIYASCGEVGTEGCAGVRHIRELPEKFTWMSGNTLHFLGYVGNSMHNWAERVWPNLVRQVAPFNATAPTPVHHFVIHRFRQLMEESRRIPDRNQLLWQARMLIELFPGADYLLLENQSHPVCFQRFLLQMHDNDRIDQTRLSPEIFKPVIRNFRAAIFTFFGLPMPQVRLPPKRLRVLFYGRHDTERRRIKNSEDVMRFLCSLFRPPLEVRSLDNMLATRQTSYSFPDVVSVYSQTDIFVIAHGANTWATFCLPEGAAVVEIFGPCNWSTKNHTDLRTMYSWMHVNAASLELKHDISNVFKESVPNVDRGNTTTCGDPFFAVPDYTVDIIALGRVISSFGKPRSATDRLAKHWQHDWNTEQ